MQRQIRQRANRAMLELIEHRQRNDHPGAVEDQVVVLVDGDADAWDSIESLTENPFLARGLPSRRSGGRRRTSCSSRPSSRHHILINKSHPTPPAFDRITRVTTAPGRARGSPTASAPARQIRAAFGPDDHVFGRAGGFEWLACQRRGDERDADHPFSANDSAASQRPEGCSTMSVTARVLALIGKCC